MTDRGYFPRGESVLRMVHEERAVGLMYGQRALGIGALAPLNFIGTDEHTRFPERPFKRLAVTGKMFETIFFGSREQADKVLAVVRTMHERVRGDISEDAGPFKAGTPYAALDPELMLWTIAVAADSAKVFYELFVRRLSGPERDRFWDEYVGFGELFGMPREVAPVGWRAFKLWFDGKVASDESHLTERAREVGAAVMFEIPFSPTHAFAKPVHDLLVLGSLPPRVRDLYGLAGLSLPQQQAFAATVRAVRASRPLTPARLRYGFNTVYFDSVAKTEANRIERGIAVQGARAAA